MSDFNQENQDDAPVATTTSTGTTTSGTTPVTTAPVTETETPDATEHAAVTTTTTGTPVTTVPVHSETTETAEHTAAGTTATGTPTPEASPDTAGVTDDAAAASAASTTGTTASGAATAPPPAPTVLAAQVLSTTPAASKDIVLDSALSTDVQLTGHTLQTTVSNFSHHDALVISADVLMGIATGQLSIAATATSVEIDNVATGQMLIHLNLDHAIGAVGIHPVANGAVSVTL